METAMLKLCALVRPALLKESPFCLPSLAAPRPSGDRGPKNLALSALVVLFISITLAGWRRPLGLRFRTTGQHHT